MCRSRVGVSLRDWAARSGWRPPARPSGRVPARLGWSWPPVQRSANPAVLAKPPRLTEEEVKPLTIEEVRRLLPPAAPSRNSARWAMALALGLRQGEALGLKWSDVALPPGRPPIRRNRLRPAWEHGCG